jgi:NAD(P)H-dependent flavin oxidoreductase YrpB (nitropropane dioxygenase family)
MHQNFFNSKYPIICASMYRVSVIKLALAVREAGCYPSLVSINHLVMDPNTLLPIPNDSTILEAVMETFFNKTGTSDYILGISSAVLLEWPSTLDLIYKYKPAYLELYDFTGFDNPEFYNLIKNLQNTGIRILIKALSSVVSLSNSKMCNAVDGVIIKGSKAAGRVSTRETNLIEDIKALKAFRNDWIIIPQGGVHDSAGIKELLNVGATAVSMGTLFALSKEAAISNEAKQKMLQASYSDTVKIGQANQVGLVFSKTGHDVENNTIGLAKGIRTGKEGHIFAGAAIDYITEIKPVSQIVAELTSGI